MKRKTFLTTLIGGTALLPVAIKEAAAQLRKPKENTGYIGIDTGMPCQYDMDCPIVMLTGVGGIISGRVLEMRTGGSNFVIPEQIEPVLEWQDEAVNLFKPAGIEFDCEVKLTRKNMGWLGANKDKQVSFVAELYPGNRTTAECFLIDYRIIEENISVTLKTDYSNETN